MRTLTRLYLLAYNVIAIFAWYRVGFLTLKHLHASGLSDIGAFWSSVKVPLQIAQSMAILEILHSLLGLIKSPLTTTGAQVISRLQLLWVVWLFVEESHQSVYCLTTVLAWTCVELIRYPFYALTLLGAVPYALKWLRYSAFILLYPAGIYSEVRCMFVSLGVMKKDRFLSAFPYPMPNRFNFEINLYWVYTCLLVAYIPGTVLLLSHMLKQRGKVLYGTPRSDDSIQQKQK